MGKNIIPMQIEGINENIYSGFWSRLGSNLLDSLIMIPFIFLITFFNSFSKNVYFLTVIPNLLFIFWYDIFLPKRYGGTPGKLIVGIKIIKINSSSIGWKEAILRHCVSMGFSIISILFMVYAILLADNEIYKNLNWLDKNVYLLNLANMKIINTLTNIWFWSEVIVLLFNKRKRALHDFIAGTVIIKSEYIEKVREKMDELNKINHEI